MRIVAALAGLALSCAYASPALAGWQQLKEPAYGYSAMFPATPKAEDSVDGSVKARTNVAAENGTLCVVMVANYGYAIDPEVELPASRDNFVKAVKGTLGSQERITISRGETALPALKFDGQSADTNYRALLIIDGMKVYGITGGVPVNGGNSSDLGRCVNGFKLLAN